MNESTFVYWLQGFVEIANTDTISEKQWQIIKDHLKLVFDKKTPNRMDINPLQTQRDPFDKQKLADLIGSNKTFVWPQSPIQITC